MSFFFNKIANGNFVEKNDNFCQFFFKKCQVSGNFLTVKWQFSGGSDLDQFWPKSDIPVFVHHIASVKTTDTVTVQINRVLKQPQSF